MITDTINVLNREGLHARPAALFVQTAKKYQSQIMVKNATKGLGPVDAKSILGVLTLCVVKGDSISITVDGPDAQAASLALRKLVESGFVGTEDQTK